MPAVDEIEFARYHIADAGRCTLVRINVWTLCTGIENPRIIGAVHGDYRAEIIPKNDIDIQSASNTTIRSDTDRRRYSLPVWNKSLSRF